MDKDFFDGFDDLLDNISSTLYLTPNSKVKRRLEGLRPIQKKSYLSLEVEVKCCSTWTGSNCAQGQIYDTLADHFY